MVDGGHDLGGTSAEEPAEAVLRVLLSFIRVLEHRRAPISLVDPEYYYYYYTRNELFLRDKDDDRKKKKKEKAGRADQTRQLNVRLWMGVGRT